MSDLIQIDGPVSEMFFNCECDQPFDIEFENRSHDVTDIVWDFGDGNSSTTDDPTHTYAATGDYTVVLTATNTITGCPISYDSATVHIRDIQAQFQSDSDHRNNGTVDWFLSNSANNRHYPTARSR